MSNSDLALTIVDCFTPASESRALVRLLERLVAEHSGRLRLRRVNVDTEPDWWPDGASASAPRLALFLGGALLDAVGRASDLVPPDEVVTAFVHRGLAANDGDCSGGACLV